MPSIKFYTSGQNWNKLLDVRKQILSPTTEKNPIQWFVLFEAILNVLGPCKDESLPQVTG